MGQLEKRGVMPGQVERRELGLEQGMGTKVLEEDLDLWQQEMVQAWMAVPMS